MEKINITAKSKGKVVIGTVQGDLHDIGKSIVRIILIASGFSVEDLGVDFSPEKFLDVVEQSDEGILGLSDLLIIAIDSVKDVINLFREKNLRHKAKIVVGGSAFREEIANRLDIYA